LKERRSEVILDAQGPDIDDGGLTCGGAESPLERCARVVTYDYEG
jgi:hypothetical protein